MEHEKLHMMGINRALTAMELGYVHSRLANYRRTKNASLKACIRESVKSQLRSIKELRRQIGEDGYKLP